jgi:hypothetical protein
MQKRVERESAAPPKPRRQISITNRENIIDGLTACICCDEPDSDKYRREVHYWLGELVTYLEEVGNAV